MRPGAPPVFSALALARTLCVPDAGEAFSPIGGPGALVLDLDASADERTPLPLPVAAIRAELARLPCVTIALGRAPAEHDLAALAADCDVHLEQRDALEPFLSAFAKTPVAALAFVQLLRGFSPARSIEDGLVAESFVYSTLQSGREFRDWKAARTGKHRRPAPESGPACLLGRDGATLEIRLNRPARHNAFSRALRDALSEGLVVALADPSIEQVVLRGEGESFCSGGDLDEFGSFPDPAAAHAIRTTRSPARLIARLAGRIRSEIHGACIGAGIELPAFTDRIVADEDTFIELPEVRLGLVPGAGGTVSIARRIGRQRTAWLGLSGRRIDAQTALDWGLVDEVRLRQHRPTREQGTNARE
ncbi:MAG: enoyl-CoA hydratase/isomerase family protein [Myxococcota bacterium]